MEDNNELYNEEKRKLDEELATVCSTVQGRRFLYRLLYQECAIDASTFSNDDRYSAYAQGRRDIGVSIKQALLNFDKEIYFNIEKENRL